MTAFVLPSLSYTALFRSELPPLKRYLCTLPGWCSLFSAVFVVINTSLVIRSIIEANEEGEDRSCAPVDLV